MGKPALAFLGGVGIGAFGVLATRLLIASALDDPPAVVTFEPMFVTEGPADPRATRFRVPIEAPPAEVDEAPPAAGVVERVNDVWPDIELRNRHNSMARRGINRMGSEASPAEQQLLWEILADHERVGALTITPAAFHMMDDLAEGYSALGFLREAEGGLPGPCGEKARKLIGEVETGLRELTTQLRSEFNL